MLPEIVARWFLRDWKPDTSESLLLSVSDNVFSADTAESDPLRIGNTNLFSGSSTCPMPEYAISCLENTGVFRFVNGLKKFEVVM